MDAETRDDGDPAAAAEASAPPAVPRPGDHDYGSDRAENPLDAGFGMKPVRLTVTDEDMKMVRSVRVRVGDAALEERRRGGRRGRRGVAARQLFSEEQNRISAQEEEKASVVPEMTDAPRLRTGTNGDERGRTDVAPDKVREFET